MIKGFVFGKFLPFHKGHEAMINFALAKCDRLTVLVCCSDRETISAAIRKNWIDETFAENENIEVKIFNYSESEIPNTSETSLEVSKKWSKIFKQLFPDYSLVVTSEHYGELVAELMNIEYQPFDIDKKQFPVSASAIRNDIFSNWNFLPVSVKPYFAIKVVILGTESTGKTILTQKLSKHFSCGSVEEAGREIIDNSNSFSFDELYLVAEEHAKRINQSLAGNSALIIIDTDIHITKSYASFRFDRELQVSEDIYGFNKAALYLYLNNDVEYIQDGTRLSEADRNLLDRSHRKVLSERNIPITEITGSWEDRFEKSKEYIDKLIAPQNTVFNK